MANVLITPEPLIGVDGPHVDLLRRNGFFVRFPSAPVVSADEAIESLAGFHAVIAGGESFDRRVLSSLPELRVIARCGVGYDRVDVPSATELGVVVTITPQGNCDGVAEHTMALLLAVTRQLAHNDVRVRQGIWDKPRLIPLRGRTLGLVGLGRIGRQVAVRAKAFGLNIIGYDPCADETAAVVLGIKLVSFETILEQSDFLSLHAPLSPQTRGIMNRKTLHAMKTGAILINTARGGLIDEEDLYVALASHKLAGAGLDVLVQEPPAADNPLFSLDTVVFSPHVAANDTQAIEDMALGAAESIVDLSCGRWPSDAVVNPEVRTNWKW